ncbi:MAG: sigma-70 family RNA polymerase sigma factor [Acidobacteria bacterium]|nr:sigma-70 family RNA polymerase sigma factor [Acidobacteriota bacterium]
MREELPPRRPARPTPPAAGHASAGSLALKNASQNLIAREAAQFATTHWSVVLTAARPSAPGAREALEQLCRTYWYPLYAYIRRRGYGMHDAQDLTQGFLEHLLERNALESIAQEKGRFRSFLLAALNYFLTDQRRHEQAQKRGGGCEFVPINAIHAEERYQFEPVDDRSPEKIFERRWALTVLAEVLTKLEREYDHGGKNALFSELHGFLVGEKTGETYAAAAARLGVNQGAVKMAVLRLRRRYRELFRETIAQTVAHPAEVEEELRHLIAAIG